MWGGGEGNEPVMCIDRVDNGWQQIMIADHVYYLVPLRLGPCTYIKYFFYGTMINFYNKRLRGQEGVWGWGRGGEGVGGLEQFTVITIVRIISSRLKKELF
jgi:hypothetical protein